MDIKIDPELEAKLCAVSQKLGLDVERYIHAALALQVFNDTQTLEIDEQHMQVMPGPDHLRRVLTAEEWEAFQARLAAPSAPPSPYALGARELHRRTVKPTEK